MRSADASEREGIRDRPDEWPPALSPGLGVQFAVLSVTASILIPTVVIRAGGESESRRAWALFPTAAIYGATTMLQALCA